MSSVARAVQGLKSPALLLALLGAAGCRPADPGALSPSPSARAEAPATEIRFEDETQRAGIRFRHVTGAAGDYRYPETFAPGCCFLDYNGDGRLDLFLVNSRPWKEGGEPPALPALYRGEGGGRLRDVTRETGLARSFYGMGCAPGDFDGDGDTDLLITGVGGNLLYRNDGGLFHDATAASGLSGGPPDAWHTSAAWLDYDRDGRLDLFICRYVRWAIGKDPVCLAGTGERTYCEPGAYRADSSLLFRNRGDGRFEDVSERTGIAAAKGRALGVVPLDHDGDGWIDLLVANDQTPNHLFVNQEGKRFDEMAQEAGVALSASGVARAGMGIDAADLFNDGGLAVAIGNFSGEGLALFRRTGPIYVDAAHEAGLIPASLTRLTFGLAFLDADRDGRLDLFTYNGHVNPHVAARGTPVGYRQAPQLFRSEGRRFRDVTAGAGAGLRALQLGRGCAIGDYDDDGRPDLLLAENGGRAWLLRNATGDPHHWLGLRLRGRGGNTDAFGAEIRLAAGGVTQRRWVRSGTSYLSQHDPRALFGLGSTATVDRVEIVWPSGRRTHVDRPAVDRYHVLDEPP